MANNIQWKLSEQLLKQELVSEKGNWHVSQTQINEEDIEYDLSNYDLLVSPMGRGKDYKECFEDFIRNCDTYLATVKKIRAEAEKHLKELLEAEAELERENQNHEN